MSRSAKDTQKFFELAGAIDAKLKIDMQFICTDRATYA